jgi:hypothetical protein
VYSSLGRERRVHDFYERCHHTRNYKLWACYKKTKFLVSQERVGPVRSKLEIEQEIEALKVNAEGYDTDKQTVGSCLAAGAHDALRWALGLYEDAPSTNFNVPAFDD